MTRQLSPGGAAPPPPRETSRAGSIVVADTDEALIRLAVDQLSQTYGARRVLGFSDARQAAALVASAQPALLICSPQLPRVGGMDLSTLAQKRWGQIPTIVLVSGAGLGPGGHLKASGKIVYLEKPFTGDALLTCIEALTELQPQGGAASEVTPALGDAYEAAREEARLALQEVTDARTDTPPGFVVPKNAEKTLPFGIPMDPSSDFSGTYQPVTPDASGAHRYVTAKTAAAAAEAPRAEIFLVPEPSAPSLRAEIAAAVHDGARGDAGGDADATPEAAEAHAAQGPDADGAGSAPPPADVADMAPDRSSVLQNIEFTEPAGEVTYSLSSVTPLPRSRPPQTEFSDVWTLGMDFEIQSEDRSSKYGADDLYDRAAPSYEGNHKEGVSAMALTSSNIKENLAKFETIDGFMGVALADSDNGMCLGSLGGATFNLEVAAAANTEVVRSKRKGIKTLNLRDEIEDILITLGKQYHILRPVRTRPNLFYYLVLDRQRSNLAMARYSLAEVERELPM